MAVRLATAIITSLKVYVLKDGSWTFLKEDYQSGNTFTFEHIDFSKFTFSCDRTQKLVTGKIRIKKVDMARFRLMNDELNQPFGIYDLAFEFVEKGNHKG